MKAELPYQGRSVSQVCDMFASISRSYDFANLILSGGMHLVWNRCLAKEAAQFDAKHFLDLCSGTGAIPRALHRVCRNVASITLVDVCPDMLQIAVRRIGKQKLQASFIAADAQRLPLLANDSYDAATMAYGIRNIPDPSLALQEAFRALKPGGRLCILELTRPRWAILRNLHRMFIKGAIPVIGAIISGKPQAYRYLAQSIANFISSEELSEMMRSSGFQNIKIQPLCGGIATIFVAEKV